MSRGVGSVRTRTGRNVDVIGGADAGSSGGRGGGGGGGDGDGGCSCGTDSIPVARRWRGWRRGEQHNCHGGRPHDRRMASLQRCGHAAVASAREAPRETTAAIARAAPNDGGRRRMAKSIAPPQGGGDTAAAVACWPRGAAAASGARTAKGNGRRRKDGSRHHQKGVGGRPSPARGRQTSAAVGRVGLTDDRYRREKNRRNRQRLPPRGAGGGRQRPQLELHRRTTAATGGGTVGGKCLHRLSDGGQQGQPRRRWRRMTATAVGWATTNNTGCEGGAGRWPPPLSTGGKRTTVAPTGRGSGRRKAAATRGKPAAGSKRRRGGAAEGRPHPATEGGDGGRQRPSTKGGGAAMQWLTLRGARWMVAAVKWVAGGTAEIWRPPVLAFTIRGPGAQDRRRGRACRRELVYSTVCPPQDQACHENRPDMYTEDWLIQNRIAQVLIRWVTPPTLNNTCSVLKREQGGCDSRRHVSTTRGNT